MKRFLGMLLCLTLLLGLFPGLNVFADEGEEKSSIETTWAPAINLESGKIYCIGGSFNEHSGLFAEGWNSFSSQRNYTMSEDDYALCGYTFEQFGSTSMYKIKTKDGYYLKRTGSSTKCGLTTTTSSESATRFHIVGAQRGPNDYFIYEVGNFEEYNLVMTNSGKLSLKCVSMFKGIYDGGTTVCLWKQTCSFKGRFVLEHPSGRYTKSVPADTEDSTASYSMSIPCCFYNDGYNLPLKFVPDSDVVTVSHADYSFETTIEGYTEWQITFRITGPDGSYVDRSIHVNMYDHVLYVSDPAELERLSGFFDTADHWRLASDPYDESEILKAEEPADGSNGYVLYRCGQVTYTGSYGELYQFCDYTFKVENTADGNVARVEPGGPASSIMNIDYSHPSHSDDGGGSGVADIPNVGNIPDTPNQPDAPNVGNIPDTPNQPDAPNVGDMPDETDTPNENAGNTVVVIAAIVGAAVVAGIVSVIIVKKNKEKKKQQI